MFRYKSATLLAVALTALVTGCAKDTNSAGEKAPELPKTSATSTTTAAPQPALNERGLFVKKLGETGGWGKSSTSSVTFSIDSITVDPPCHEYGTPPESGHTLLLSVRVATSDDLDAAQLTGGILNPFSFSEVGADGVTRTAEMGTCTGYDTSLPNEFGVNQKYAGTIELVVPEASGVLALQTSMLNDMGGWEWAY